MTDVDAIRARWAAVQVGDWTRWTAADLSRVCRQSTATLTAVLHAPDDVRTLLHEVRVLRAHRDWLTDHAGVEQAYRRIDALTVERDAARALACDLVSQQPGPAAAAAWAELDEPAVAEGSRAMTLHDAEEAAVDAVRFVVQRVHDEPGDVDEIRAARDLGAEILILDTGDGWAAFAWGEHDPAMFRAAAEVAALQSTGEPLVAEAVRSGGAEECVECAAMVGNTGGYIVFGGPHLDDGADDTWEHCATCTDDECEEDCAGRWVSPHGGGRRGVATWAYLSSREAGS